MAIETSPLADNLKRLIQFHDSISLLSLAKQTGIPQPTLHHILSGGTRKPRRAVLETLASFFSISISQLIGEKPLPKIPDTIKSRCDIATVPVLLWDMLYTWPEHTAYAAREIILERKVHPHSFAIYMNDNDAAFEKSLLIFDAGKKPRNKDLVVAVLGNDRVLARLMIEPPHIFLKPTNTNEAIRFQASHRILGSLVEIRLEI